MWKEKRKKFKVIEIRLCPKKRKIQAAIVTKPHRNCYASEFSCQITTKLWKVAFKSQIATKFFVKLQVTVANQVRIWPKIESIWRIQFVERKKTRETTTGKDRNCAVCKKTFITTTKRKKKTREINQNLSKIWINLKNSNSNCNVELSIVDLKKFNLFWL